VIDAAPLVPVDGDRQNTVLVTIPAEQEFVGVVRLVVGSAAASMGLNEEEIADLKLAVSEACTNAVLHAYASSPVHTERTVEVQLALSELAVEVDVCDKGGGLAPGTPAAAVDYEEGGFGLTLIGCLMDSLELLGDCDSGTRLKFVKRHATA